MRRLIGASAVVLALCGGASAHAQTIEVGEMPHCVEFIPAAVALNGGGRELTVQVVRDGVGEVRAAEIVDRARLPFARFGISLEVSYVDATLTGTGTEDLLDQLKALSGGVRPAGVDLVYGLTSKDIGSGEDDGDSDSTAGRADCIGGIAHDDHAFAVGEDLADFGFEFGFLSFGLDVAAKILAHELGHLLGAHHHHASCAEGVGRAMIDTPDGPCTLMFNDVGFQALAFSAVNAQIVRGHIDAYG